MLVVQLVTLSGREGKGGEGKGGEGKGGVVAGGTVGAIDEGITIVTTTALTAGATAGTAAVSSDAAATTGAAVMTSVAAAPVALIVVGAEVSNNSYSWDCWKPLLHCSDSEPSNGIAFQNLLTDSLVRTCQMLEERARTCQNVRRAFSTSYINSFSKFYLLTLRLLSRPHGTKQRTTHSTATQQYLHGKIAYLLPTYYTYRWRDREA